jgi:hypothetical protein
LLLPSDLQEPVWLFPFEGMEVGDSFFVPTLRSAEMTYVINCRAKAAGVRVKIYNTTHEDVMGVRAWRVR